ncbi:MAG: hypothetical protein U0235_27505 [Polyangiaceae bacterium]
MANWPKITLEELQIPLKLERLANLAPETKYVLYKDVNLLETWGGADAVAADPVHVIHSVVRAWHDRARIKQTLARIAKHPLIIRPDAKIAGLKLAPDERAVLDAIREQRATMSVLQHMRLADAGRLHSLVYVAITRQLDLRTKRRRADGASRGEPPAPPPRHSGAAFASQEQRRLRCGILPRRRQARSAPQSSAEITAIPDIADAIASALSSPPPAGASSSTALPPRPARPSSSMSSPPCRPSRSPRALSRPRACLPCRRARRLTESARARAMPSSSGTPVAAPASNCRCRRPPSAPLDQGRPWSLETIGALSSQAAVVEGDFLTAESLAREAIELDSGDRCRPPAEMAGRSSRALPGASRSRSTR